MNLLRCCAAVLLAPLLAYCSGSAGALPAPDISRGALSIAAAPRHVLTAAYLYSPDGLTSHGRPFRAYSSSLTWAETYSGSAVSAAGIKTLYYTNPNRISSTDPLYVSDERAYAHTCTGARIYQSISSTKYYLTNPASTTLVNAYKAEVAAELQKQHFDAILDDEPFDWYALSGMPCNYNATTWLNAYIAEEKAVGHPVVYNGLGILGANGSLSPSFAMNAGTVGGMGEACYSAAWNPHLSSGSAWRGMENTELAMASQGKLFFCYSNDLANAATSIPIRLYVYASFLLTYNSLSSILWEYFATASGYSVEPESQLVALAPLLATPTSITQLYQSTGVYARRYNACYIAAVSIGPCAAVVNPDPSAAHAFPFSSYRHTIYLAGGGILDGGTISSHGAAPPATLQPLTGVIATP